MPTLPTIIRNKFPKRVNDKPIIKVLMIAFKVAIVNTFLKFDIWSIATIKTSYK